MRKSFSYFCCVIALLAARVGLAASGEGEIVGAISLSRAEQLMRENTPALRIARYAYEASNADVVTAAEGPNPQLSINSSAIKYSEGSGPGTLWEKQIDSIVRVDQQIERGGKRGLRGKAARAGEQAAAADYADTLRTSRLNLAQAYFDLKFAQEAERIAASLIEVQAQSLRAAQLRFKDGDIASVDFSRLQIEAARAEANFSAARNQRRDAQLTLAQLLGLKDCLDNDCAELQASDPWPAPLNDRALVDSSVRPDVRAAQARSEQAQANVALAQAQRTRDVTVGVQFEHYPQPSTNANSVGVGFSVPLFLRHRYQGEIQRANADRHVAEETLRNVQLVAASDRAHAAADLFGSRERLRHFEGSIVEKAKAAAEAAEYAYLRGALNLTDLLDARRAMQSVELDELSAQTAYAKALAAWRAETDTSAWTSAP
ncbi:MAG TPA: TolC family protein [Steroidobacteraceae bacterium]|nr:TolC family protein [Steroidobacteraceae bacterium]